MMMMRGLATLLVTLPPVSMVSVVQKFVREPPDQTAAEGEHVTLPCRVDNKVTGHNSDLSDIREYTFCFLICGVRRITIDKSRSFCRLVSTKSNSLLLCLVKSKNLRTPHVFLYVLMGVSQI